MGKKALITGITGQDGSYMAEFLLSKGYEIYGTIRRLSTPNYWRIEHIMDNIHLVQADLSDQYSIADAIKKIEPDEIYNFAAQSFVKTSFEQPVYTSDVTALGVLRILEAIRHIDNSIKFYQASSSEMFGKAEETPQNEKTPFHPRSPYAISKVFAHFTTINYREAYKIFACCGIAFNHESPRRGIEFVTRKISDGVARIYLKKQKKLILGNLTAKRDWGFAGDYVKAMWKMLQQKQPEEFVIATGKAHSVKEFVEEAFKVIGKEDLEKYVKTSEEYKRPSDVEYLLGDYSKGKKILQWEPRTQFKDLVKMMVEADIERLS